MRIKNSHVIVTGGAGFIGSHLVDQLISMGNKVTIVDDFSTGSYENLVDHKNNSQLNVEEADIRDEQRMLSLFKGVDFVFHLACRNIRLSLRQPTLVHDVNITGTLSVLKAAAGARVKLFLYCSSSEVNGTAGVVPMPEDYLFRPETIYGASKLAGEYYTQVFQRSGWLSTIIARPHNNYGPRGHYSGDKGEVIPRFILWALLGKPLLIYGDGKQTRDFTYVTETAHCLIKLLECDAAVGGVFNICRGEEVSILEIARIISEFTGLDSPPIHIKGRPSDVLRLFGDPTKLRTALGFAPNISIRDGLRESIDWFRNNVTLNDKLAASLQSENWEDVEPEQWMNRIK